MMWEVDADVVMSLRAKFEAVLPHLGQRQQRLVLAGEARSLGYGGIAAVAQASGASRSRISAGVAQLEAGETPLGRTRRSGGGRKQVTETDPELIAQHCWEWWSQPAAATRNRRCAGRPFRRETWLRS